MHIYTKMGQIFSFAIFIWEDSSCFKSHFASKKAQFWHLPPFLVFIALLYTQNVKIPNKYAQKLKVGSTARFSLQNLWDSIFNREDHFDQSINKYSAKRSYFLSKLYRQLHEVFCSINGMKVYQVKWYFVFIKAEFCRRIIATTDVLTTFLPISFFLTKISRMLLAFQGKNALIFNFRQ